MRKVFIISILTVFFFLCTMIIVSAQTVIYRSVQNNTGAIWNDGTGARTLTISGSTATFSSAAPDTIGVGEVIEYDKDGNGTVDNLAFIHGRTSSTVFTVKDSLGVTTNLNAVTNCAKWNIFHPYLTLGAWETGSENTGILLALRNFDAGNRDISAANEQWNIAIYTTQTVSSAYDIDSWNTGVGSGTYIKIYAPYLSSEVGKSQRHNGVFSGTAATLSYGSATVLEFSLSTSTETKDIRVEGLQIKNTVASGTANATCIGIQTGGAVGFDFDIEITDCILVGTTDTGSAPNGAGVYIGPNSSSPTAAIVRISNCVIYGFTNANTVRLGGIATTNVASTKTIYAYNNTLFKNKFGCLRASSTFTAINCLADSNTTDFSGTFTNAEYNASGDATAPGTNTRKSQIFHFTNSVSRDLSLTVADTAAADRGKDLSGDVNLAVTTDIIKTARPKDSPAVVGNAFDIGAFEMAISGNRGRIIQVKY